MAAPHPAAKLGWIVIPLAIAPFFLAIWPMGGAWFFVVAGTICFAAPAAGFWWGEMKGDAGSTKAALGCAGTAVMFIVYLLWALVVARMLFR